MKSTPSPRSHPLSSVYLFTYVLQTPTLTILLFYSIPFPLLFVVSPFLPTTKYFSRSLLDHSYTINSLGQYYCTLCSQGPSTVSFKFPKFHLCTSHPSSLSFLYSHYSPHSFFSPSSFSILTSSSGLVYLGSFGKGTNTEK